MKTRQLPTPSSAGSAEKDVVGALPLKGCCKKVYGPAVEGARGLLKTRQPPTPSLAGAAEEGVRGCLVRSSSRGCCKKVERAAEEGVEGCLFSRGFCKKV